MLKPTSQQERFLQANKDMRIVLLASYVAGLVAIAFMIQDLPDLWTILFWAAIYGVSNVLSGLVWILATLWLAKVPLRAGLYALTEGDKRPKFVQYFMEAWWNNELVLKIFIGTFQLVLALGIYRLLAPIFGMQGWQMIHGAG